MKDRTTSRSSTSPAGRQPPSPSAMRRARSSWVRQPATRRLSIVNFAFVPALVTIAPGDRVTWRNDDGAPHQIAFKGGDTGSDTLSPGKTYGRTFDKPGSYDYFLHVSQLYDRPRCRRLPITLPPTNPANLRGPRSPGPFSQYRVRRTVMRKTRRGPTAEAAEQRASGADPLKPQPPGRVDRNGDVRVVADGGPRRADDSPESHARSLAGPQPDRERPVLRPGMDLVTGGLAKKQADARRKTESPHDPPPMEREYPKNNAWAMSGQSL